MRRCLHGCWQSLGSRMTRDQQIRKALQLLAPPRAQREECKDNIVRALDRIENTAGFARSCRVARSKNKGGITSYYAALRCLCSAFRSLDPAIKPWFSFADPAYTTGQALEKELAKAEEFLNRRSARPRRHASHSKAAVVAAHDLLGWRNHEATTTRGGNWEQLAKVLAGDLTVDLFDHLREFKRSPGRISEKIRYKDVTLYRSSGRQPGIKLSRITSEG
jgi:hypothetical protein